MTLRLDSGSTTYWADDLSGIAGLVAQDGDFDFSVLDEQAVRRLYLAGKWYLPQYDDAPGVSALRKGIREEGRPYLVFNVCSEQDAFGLDTGEGSYVGPVSSLAGMNTAVGAFTEFDMIPLGIKVDRFPEWFQGKLRRELSDFYEKLVSQLRTVDAVGELDQGRGYLLPMRGSLGNFRPFFLDQHHWNLTHIVCSYDAPSRRDFLVKMEEHVGLFRALNRHKMWDKALVVVIIENDKISLTPFDEVASKAVWGIYMGHTMYDKIQAAALMVSGTDPTTPGWVSPFAGMVGQIRNARWR